MEDAASRAAEAKRALLIAEKLLTARDLVGSKKFAERAIDSDPLLDGVDQVLAVADVLLAAQRRINNHIDWYAILQLDSYSLASDPAAVKGHYRRLALLLHPERNRHSGAHEAFKLVVDAWSLLSDPSKKSLLDKELSIAAAHSKSNGEDRSSAKRTLQAQDEGAFWTACLHCCRVYQYGREYENRNLRCQNCKKAFRAEEMSAPPPIVPGTDMYYCSWGLFPIGFPGGPVFNELSATGRAEPKKPFSPVTPWWGGNQQSSQPVGRRDGPTNTASQPGIESGKQQQSSAGKDTEQKKMASMANTTRRKKKMAVKPPKEKPASFQKQGSSIGSRVDINEKPKNDATTENGEGNEMKEPETIDINHGVGASANPGVMGGETHFDMNRFIIDLDATDAVLGNLSNLPFLKDEEHYIQPSLFDG